MSKEKVTSSGIGFLSLLGILFIGLKLTNYIDWSWWLVLLPLYGPLVIWITIFVVVIIGVFICALIKK